MIAKLTVIWRIGVYDDRCGRMESVEIDETSKTKYAVKVNTMKLLLQVYKQQIRVET